MRYIVLILMLLSGYSHAAVKAVTDEGEIVLLHADGTWEYEHSASDAGAEIGTNDSVFLKTASSDFQVKSAKTDAATWIDPRKWNFKKAASNEDAEYEFQLKGQDLYGMMISEGIEIAPETLTEIALENARTVAPDVKILKREYRKVNGLRLIYMEMRGTTQGVSFTYHGYYFSNSQGTTQYIAYTASNLVQKYEQEILEFLNGFSTR